MTHTLSASTLLTIHSLHLLGLAAAFSILYNIFGANLISDPHQSLHILCLFQCPFTVLSYSLLRRNPQDCSFLKAVGRAVVGLPAGALVNASGAIILGAPIGIQYLTKTLKWSLLMSSFTFVPAASNFGSSWKDWQRLFAYFRPTHSVDYMIALPAHGAIIGAWLGAWPMPLDWERPWQEWPICVTYGSIAGYVLGILASLVFTLLYHRPKHAKDD